MWSWYFVLLDFLNEELPWRSSKSNKMDDVKNIKTKCLADPEHCLWKTTTSSMPEVKNIFYKINELSYPDRPDYNFIRLQLNTLLKREEGFHASRSLETFNTFCVISCSDLLAQTRLSFHWP